MTEILTESFCERCGTRYTFEAVTPRGRRLGGLRVLGRGLKTFVMADDTSLDEALASARSDQEREVASRQLDAFHKTFNFCMSCRQYTCANCWNDLDARCLSCAPRPGDAPLSAPFVLGSAPAAALPQGLGVADHVHVAAEAPGSAIDGWQAPEEAVAAQEVVSARESVEAPAAFEAAVVDGPEVADRASAAAAQTSSLLARFRPGVSLDDEIAAYEASVGADGGEPTLTEPAGEVAASDVAVPVGHEAVAPEPVAAEAATPEPVAAESVTPEPRRDVVEQPSWPSPAVPSNGPSEAPSWPTGPRLPTAIPARPTSPPTSPLAGPSDPATAADADPLAFLSARRSGDAFWAASAQNVARPVQGPPATATVRPCVSCGLSLSGTARFCRRCGTRQEG